MIGYTGKTFNLTTEILGRVAIKKADGSGTSYLLSLDPTESTADHYALIRCGKPVVGIYSSPSLLCDQDIQLEQGDIVRITKTGKLLVLFSSKSNDNCLFVTNSCNSKCIMCPQPPRADEANLYTEAAKILEFVEDQPEVLGITGGEPLLNFSGFLSLIKLISTKFPETQIQLLTNGRILSDPQKALKVIDIAGDNITFCIPLYGDQPHTHDTIVGIQGAFAETVEALHHLGRLNARIELRTVVLPQNAHRLAKWGTFVCKNLPFVEHVAVMGLEPIGIAAANFSDVWIDPVDYQDVLDECIFKLSTFGLIVSIFNHQLCTLPETLWPYSVRSISGWKIRYIDECKDCQQKLNCGGLFFASERKHSREIKAIKSLGA